MSCVNDHYTPEELESIFLWDSICDALPLTAEERREINERDCAARSGNRERSSSNPSIPRSDAERAKEEERKQRKREQKRRWRQANKERIREAEAAYRARNREAINERQREYDRAKRASEKLNRMSAQP